MVATRSKKSEDSEAGEKRAAPSTTSQTKQPASKKAKTEPDGKLTVGQNGQLGLKEETTDDDNSKDTKRQEGEESEKDDETSAPKPKAGEDMDQTRDEMKAEEGEKAEKGEDEVDEKALQGIKGELEEPKHGKWA